MQSFSILLAPLFLAIMVGAWFAPWFASAFVMLGAIPYYALLHLLGVETSGALTGVVFGAAGAGAAMRVVLFSKGSLAPVKWPLVLFLVFELVWYTRWLQDPPSLISEEVAQFAERSYLLMAVFGILPFLTGLAVQTQEHLRRLLRAAAFWGAVALSIGAFYWMADMPNLGAEWSERWEPIPSLTGIVFSLDLALGCLALIGSDIGRRSTWGRLARVGAVLCAAALVVRIGERGPFVSFVLALGVLIFSDRRNWTRQAVMAVMAGAVIASIAGYVGERHTSRSFSAEGYTRSGNESRLVLVEKAANLVAESPFVGWGGSLVGVNVEGVDQSWKYLHIFLFDPLLETGLLGAIPFALLCWLVLLNVLALWRAQAIPMEARGVLLALFVGTFLEGQVSGHVSGAKHLWLMFGIMAAAHRWIISEPQRAADQELEAVPRSRYSPIQVAQR